MWLIKRTNYEDRMIMKIEFLSWGSQFDDFIDEIDIIIIVFIIESRLVKSV